jgi:hypothetical protein
MAYNMNFRAEFILNSCEIIFFMGFWSSIRFEKQSTRELSTTNYSFH